MKGIKIQKFNDILVQMKWGLGKGANKKGTRALLELDAVPPSSLSALLADHFGVYDAIRKPRRSLIGLLLWCYLQGHLWLLCRQLPQMMLHIFWAKITTLCLAKLFSLINLEITSLSPSFTALHFKTPCKLGFQHKCWIFGAAKIQYK